MKAGLRGTTGLYLTSGIHISTVTAPPKPLLAPCSSAFLTTSLGSRLYHPVAATVKTIFSFLSELFPSLQVTSYFSMFSVCEYIFPHTCTNYILITSLVAVVDFSTVTMQCQQATDLLIEVPAVFTAVGQIP